MEVNAGIHRTDGNISTVLQTFLNSLDISLPADVASIAVNHSTSQANEDDSTGQEITDGMASNTLHLNQKFNKLKTDLKSAYPNLVFSGSLTLISVKVIKAFHNFKICAPHSKAV